MSIRRALVLVAVVILAVPAFSQLATDVYGGYVAAPSPNGATGAWRVEKHASKWLLVTPAGNYFWMAGVYTIAATGTSPSYAPSYHTLILNKYGSNQTWGAVTNRRLLSWGFNSIGEFSSDYVTGASVRLPYVVMVPTSMLAIRKNASGAQPVKDLIHGMDSYYTGYKGGNSPDFFDPNFAKFSNWVYAKRLPNHLTDAYFMGVSTDDSDALYGFGPGPEVPGLGGIVHAHLGYIALCTRPYQSSNSNLGISAYSDTKVYSKFALRNMLAAKYGTIAALNAAWGSHYTTFDSAGGYGAGTGLLDEDGRHSWVGNYTQSSVPSAALKADLDAFLTLYAQQYFAAVHQAIRNVSAKPLIFGPATLDSHGGLTRSAILKGIGKNMDILQVTLHNNQQVLDLTATYAGDIAMAIYMLSASNKDSDLYAYPAGSSDFISQAARGSDYAATLNFGLNGTVTATGTQPIVGLKFWGWRDSWGQKRAFGLVSFLDNAYDGKQSLIATSTDQFGYKRGGEKANYGSFLGAVTTANRTIPNVVVTYVSTH